MKLRKLQDVKTPKKELLKTLWVWLKIGWNIFTTDKAAALFVYEPALKTIKMHHINLKDEATAVQIAEMYTISYRQTVNQKLQVMKMQRFPHLN